MELLIPLKLKYKSFRAYRFGTYRTRTGNSHGLTPKYPKNDQGKGIRRRCYNTHNMRSLYVQRKDQVRCPACKGRGCTMCDGYGKVYRTTALLWQDMMKISGLKEE